MSERPLHGLDSCGCCSGTSRETPAEVANRPGLSAIAYRVGTHGAFLETLLARISGSGAAALRRLRTRDERDFTIALLDAFSSMADVLTFYQERIANEAYLRTATERRSVLELARLIGYELRPGLAAAAQLAFNVEDARGGFGQALVAGTTTPTAPEHAPPVPIPVGTKVQTVPGPEEKPQFFETTEAIVARAQWNAMRPRLRLEQQVDVDADTVVLDGVALGVSAGDRVLVVEDLATRRVRIVSSVAEDGEEKLTTLTLLRHVELTPPTETRYSVYHAVVYEEAEPHSFTPGNTNEEFALDQTMVGGIVGLAVEQGTGSMSSAQWESGDLMMVAAVNRWNTAEMSQAVNSALEAPPALLGDSGVYVFRDRASIFGHNAPAWRLITSVPNSTFPDADWEDAGIVVPDATSAVDLDRAYEKVTGGWVALQRPFSAPEAFAIASVEEINRTGFTLSAKVTRLHVAQTTGAGNLGDYRMRKTTAYVRSEKLPVARVPDTSPVSGTEIVLGRFDPFLAPGQTVIVTGERSDLATVFASETKTISAVTILGGFTRIAFATALAHSYVRKTVTINANVAPATHGETVREILGSGDATTEFQRFPLKQPPLTYVSAAGEGGVASTLEVWVNEVLWQEVPSFYGRGPDERIYVTEQDDEGGTTVIFGDGRTGARLPTGDNNVTARYRRGIGRDGLVPAGRITMLMNKPVGVQGVTNPIASANAADPETLAVARNNASLTALTLGRVVSLQDFEDYARAFAGIAKAHARWSWSGEQRQIVLTVAGTNGDAIADESDLQQDLTAALRNDGDPHVRVRVVTYEPRWFRLSVKVRVAADRIPEKVLAAVRARLLEEFSFDARSFGEPVHLSEVVAIVSSVEGVTAVDVDELYAWEGSPGVQPRIGAVPPSPASPARLLTLVPLGLRVEAMS